MTSFALRWGDHHVSNVAGEITLVCGLALWMATRRSIRRSSFELFLYAHHLYIPFVIFFILHVGIGFASIMLPGLYLFAIDRYLRLLQSRENARLLSARILPCKTLELNFSKAPSLKYNPTSIIFINVAAISKLQWHPFTVTSSSRSEKDVLSVVIKCEGTWTTKLYETISSSAAASQQLRLPVSVEGPYGPPETDRLLLAHETLVMISGGSGITPFISVLRELASVSVESPIPKIRLVAVFKNSSHLSTLELVLPASNAAPAAVDFDLQIEAYVTRETRKNYDGDKFPSAAARTVYLKPCASDAPISPTLGPNGWLWLAAIISSSFAVFLVVLGAFNRYAVYPVDGDTNNLYSYTKKGSMNVLFISLSIMITATGAYLWNKKHNADEASRLQQSPDDGSATHPDAAVETESLPLQSIMQSVAVHYGHRPDLKKKLQEMEESSVGVLVSGPKELRQDVAAICSSVDNLHFKSISFTW
ncbi:hypothetical protein M569_06925 [Genlisea aurea]|uniref:FAD-binding FR-type domain-containing protein n=1 Tax=Genlisea aurea TaxID=192259 RepID=S8CL56_9LAMI|nr:hypothetical protein M569_06925 [Genlisea aurea]